MTIYADKTSQQEVASILKDAPKDVLIALAKIGICFAASDGVITEKEEEVIEKLLED